MASSGPNLAGFNTFIYSVMKIDPLYLPTDDVIIPYAFDVALSIVNPALRILGNRGPTSAWSPYELAVYNLGGSNIINFAQDQTGRTYFADLRDQLGIARFTPGVVSSSSDNGTGDSLLNPDFMRTMTLQNLQAIKDPYGRQYLMFAQAFGPLWGLT